MANHFAEWAGFDCDYSLLPTTTTRRGFVREYLEAHKTPGMNGASELNGQLATEAEVDELMRQVDAFRGFPGFYWYVGASSRHKGPARIPFPRCRKC
ncbi:hypothetical protein IMZ48_46750 [Candidatus Bathyarchaeota archaeon]|nr:hypothetical protein [Candidatus Bathyarchaeota archaeon]